VAGLLTPIKISALDANDNPITRTPQDYTISVTSGQFLHEGGYKSSFTVNKFKNLTFYYQAPLSGTTSAEIQITNTINVEGTSGKILQNVVIAKPVITLNNATVQGTIALQLKNTDDTSYTDEKGIKQLNLTGLQKIDIKIQDTNNGKTIAVDSEVRVRSKNNLLNI
jgi:hypothetical protein